MDRTVRMDVRLSPGEKARIVESARLVGVSPAEFVRSRALEEAQVSPVGSASQPSGDVESSRDLGGARPNPRRGSPPRPVPVSPRASMEDVEAVKVPPAPDLSALLRFGCPVHGCGMRAGSPKAVCGAHGRRVVER